MKKIILPVSAFAIAIASVFVTKTVSAKTGKFSVTRYTLDNSTPQQCVQVTCTSIVTPNKCAIHGLYTDNACTSSVSDAFVYRPQ